MVEQFSMQKPGAKIEAGLPALLVLAVMVLVVAGVIHSAGGDPLALARLGTRFSQGDPNGTAGYDGQFVYYIARELRPESVAPLLDAPAYRYQRILLPLLARIFSFGSLGLLPWALAILGILSQAAGTWLLGELLAGWGVSRWYALSYGLWAGFTLAVRLDLPEALAYALVAAALLATIRGRPQVGWAFYGLALFSKEVVIPFLAAQLLADLVQRRWRNAAGLALVGVLPYLVFQAWLWWVFGQLGIGSGGEMATPFELVPFMGFLRIASYSPVYFASMLVVFGPAIIFPAIWGIWIAVKQGFSKQGFSNEINVVVLALLFNALVIVFLPFSTFRETGGLLRFACGLAMAILLFAGRFRLLKALNLSFFWLVLNLFLLKS